MMYTAVRLKQRVMEDKIVLTFPELRKLKGRELEIIIMVEGEIEDSSKPPKAIQNSPHVAGSIILDEEAVNEYLNRRLR